MITYGENDRAFPYSRPYNNQVRTDVDYVTGLASRKMVLVRRIEQLEAEMKKCQDELKGIEHNLFLHTNKQLEQGYDQQGKKISKKDMIIEYYNRNTPIEKIAEAVGVSSNYVHKVLSEYRKKNGIGVVPKGQQTKERIIRCLSAGMSVKATALYTEVSKQYVSQVKKEFEMGQEKRS